MEMMLLEDQYPELQPDNLRVPEKKLPYIDSYQIWLDAGKPKTLFIKAECGQGKTFSLQKLVKEFDYKVLYVSHRIALNEENADYFTDTVTVNSLHKIRELDSYDFVVVDEWTGIESSALPWKELKLTKFCDAMAIYSGNYIFIDRDLTETKVEDILKLTYRSDITSYFYQAEPFDRVKAVKLTWDINAFAEELNKCYGIKIICSDNAKQLKKLYKLDWGCKTYLLTSKTVSEAMPVKSWLEQIELEDNCVVLCSPKIQEGTSFTGDKFVFNGYLMYGTKGILLPAQKVYQATMRVRNLSAARVVCLQRCPKQLEEVAAEDLYYQFLNNKGQLLEFNKSFRSLGYDWAEALKKEYMGQVFKIYERTVAETREQIEDIQQAIKDEFWKGGFWPSSDYKKKQTKINFKALPKPVIPEGLEKLTDEEIELLLNSDEKKSDAVILALLEKQRQRMAYKANCNKQLKLYMGKLEELVNTDSLKVISSGEAMKAKVYRDVLVENFNILILAAGGDSEVNKQELTQSLPFKKLKRLICGSKEPKTIKWFTNYAKDLCGHEFKPCGYKRSSLRLDNSLNNIIDKNSLNEIIKDYPDAIPEFKVWCIEFDPYNTL